MKDGKRGVKVNGAQGADQDEYAQQAASCPEADAASCQSLRSHLRFALNNGPDCEQCAADEQDPHVEAEQPAHVHEVAASPLAPGQFAGGEYGGTAHAEVHHFVVGLTDLPHGQSGGLHDAQRLDLDVIKAADQDGRSDGCRQNEQRRAYDEANGQSFALFHE